MLFRLFYFVLYVYRADWMHNLCGLHVINLSMIKLISSSKHIKYTLIKT